MVVRASTVGQVRNWTDTIYFFGWYTNYNILDKSEWFHYYHNFSIM